MCADRFKQFQLFSGFMVFRKLKNNAVFIINCASPKQAVRVAARARPCVRACGWSRAGWDL